MILAHAINVVAASDDVKQGESSHEIEIKHSGVQQETVVFAIISLSPFACG